MATAPTPAPAATPVATQVTVSAKLQTQTNAYIGLQASVGRKFDGLVAQAVLDKTEGNMNKEQVRSMIQQAFKQAYATYGASKEGGALKDAALATFILDGMKKSGPDISKVVTLAFPKDDGAATELEKARAEGLGLNAQLEIARGNTTVEGIRAERANKAAGAAQETARPGNATNPSTTAKPAAQAPTPEAPATSKLSAVERFQMQAIALLKFGKELGLTADAMQDALTDAIADHESANGAAAPATQA